MRKNILEVENLSMHFTSGWGKRKVTVKAVDSISFNVREAETFGLVGESGCGKTTTGRTIIRIYNPTSGSIRYDGKEISGKMTKELRKYLANNMAMIFQDPVESLNPRMTVGEIVAEGLRAKGVRDQKEIERRVYEMLDKVGLTREHATRYPHEFSGGQRQRIGIARALIIEPKLIIADEPVSALDVSIQAQVINLLNQLKRELGLTIIFIAHDLSVVKYFSDRIGVMYYGKIVELANSDDLYRNPMHPYTQSLLSAIPRPDPRTEKTRQRLVYTPEEARETLHEGAIMREVTPEHFVLCTEEEYHEYQRRFSQS